MESRFGDGLAQSPFAEKSERKTTQVTKSAVQPSTQSSDPEVIIASPQTEQKRDAVTQQEDSKAGLWVTTALVGTGIVAAAGVAVAVGIRSRNRKYQDCDIGDGEHVEVVYDKEYGGPLEQEDEDF